MKSIASGLKAFCFSAALLAAIPLASAVYAQGDKKPENIAPAPVIIRYQAHGMGANDFQVARSKHREIELEIKKKGVDQAFTEWMQRDHPYIFAKVCIKEVGQIATSYKSTNHMQDFDKLIEKRGDLRLNADKYGHDVAFAEWLRTERPDVYLQHFGVKPGKKVAEKNN